MTNRVDSRRGAHSRRSPARLRATASVSRGRTTRTFRSRRCCCRRRCGRTLRRSTPSPARPTISPTRRTARPEERYRLLEDWRELLWQSAEFRGGAGPPVLAALSRRWATRIRVCNLPVGALRGSAQRLPPGRRDDALRVVGAAARLLPAVGQPGRSAGPAHRRLRRRRGRAQLRRCLHGAAAHQLLAGSRRSTGGAGVSTCRAEETRGGRRPRSRPRRRSDHAGLARGACGRRRAHAGALRRGARRLRSRGRAAALRAARDVAGRTARARSPRVVRIRRVHGSSPHRPPRRARRSRWQALRWPRGMAGRRRRNWLSTLRMWPCSHDEPRHQLLLLVSRPDAASSVAPSSPSGISAARSTMRSTRCRAIRPTTRRRRRRG